MAELLTEALLLRQGPHFSKPLLTVSYTFLQNPALPSSGRLNVLANVVRKPMAQIFAEFSGKKLKGPEGYVCAVCNASTHARCK